MMEHEWNGNGMVWELCRVFYINLKWNDYYVDWDKAKQEGKGNGVVIDFPCFML